MGQQKPARRIFSVDASGLAADARIVDALARLQLLGRRDGWNLRLENASDELAGLIELAGLADVLPVSGVRPRSTGPRY
jgi:hypothetical protein